MKKFLITAFIVFVSIFVGYLSREIVEAQTYSKITSVKECGNLNFRFLITENDMYSANVRHIEIFMDNSSFSEENLTKMFKYLSAENTDAKILLIDVKTHWNQFLDFDDCLRGTGSSNRPPDPTRNDYHTAKYRRGSKSQESYKYNPVLNTDDYKTVNLLVKESK